MAISSTIFGSNWAALTISWAKQDEPDFANNCNRRLQIWWWGSVVCRFIRSNLSSKKCEYLSEAGKKAKSLWASHWTYGDSRVGRDLCDMTPRRHHDMIRQHNHNWWLFILEEMQMLEKIYELWELFRTSSQISFRVANAVDRKCTTVAEAPLCISCLREYSNKIGQKESPASWRRSWWREYGGAYFYTFLNTKVAIEKISTCLLEQSMR